VIDNRLAPSGALMALCEADRRLHLVYEVARIDDFTSGST
jgi:hypothetical protein